ncbi:MAG: hypothetical protein HYS45_02170 [Parcubacteria group bacterium]|nr:hypothetical protein [Parcubacteria group bacterium]
MAIAPQTLVSRSFLQSVKYTVTASVLGIAWSAVFALLGAPSVFAAEAPVLSTPVQAQQFDSPMPPISGRASGSSEVLVFIDNALNGTAKVKDGRFAYAPFLPLGSGGHAIQLQARAAETGELSEKSLVTLITIIPNPAPTLLVPQTQAKLGQDRVWAGGVARNGSLVRILVDGAEHARAKVRNHASGTASFGVELKGLSLGAHTIMAVARDSRGKESFASNSVDIAVLPRTPAPVLARPVVNADSGIERPFVAGLAKNSFVVSIVIDGKLAQSIPLGQDPSGAISFAWQPRTALTLGRHVIEAYASDRGKLSNNSAPIFWQVGEAAEAAVAAPGEAPAPVDREEPKAEQVPPISVSAPEAPKPLTVKDELALPEEPVVPDALPEKVATEPEGRVVADDDAVLGESTEQDRVAVADNEAAESPDDGVVELAPGAVVRLPDEAPQKFTLNTSLVIGIVILVFLLLSILVWYIQEKRAQLGERVVNIFREEDEGASGAEPSGTSRLPGDAPHTDSVRPPYGAEPLGGEKKRKENTESKDKPPHSEPWSGFDGPDDLPPPPPPMF